MKPLFFKFESDFAASGIRCIPMIVRFKLDACGIKLKLQEWSCMQQDERIWLVSAPCCTPVETQSYRQTLCALILERTGNAATEIHIMENPPWSRIDEIPFAIKEKMRETGWACALAQWQGFSDLQRFALWKLSFPGHENRNFPKAMAEFTQMPVVTRHMDSSH